uniref:Uncharacterized protein n=1 Tax=Arundo donax TaxID=35708 RepID=A0A0A9FIV3_ARUDO
MAGKRTCQKRGKSQSNGNIKR